VVAHASDHRQDRFGILDDRQRVPGPLWLWVVCIVTAYDLGASSVTIATASQ
jgi:hypothetical protein